MTDPQLNYAMPGIRVRTPLIAWLSIAMAAIAFLVSVFATYCARSQTMAFTNSGNGTGMVLVSSPTPMWVHLLQVLAAAAPLAGLVVAIMAVRRSNTNKAVAIVGIVLNALMLGALILCALLLIA